MALLICKPCTTAYAVGAPKCPHCGSTEYAEQGSPDDPTLVVAPEPVAAPVAKAGKGRGVDG